MHPPQTPFEAQANRHGRITSQAADLQQGIDGIRGTLGKNTTSANELTETLTCMEQVVKALHDDSALEYTSGCHHAPPSDASAAKAAKVFCTPELLEMILLYVQPGNLLRTQPAMKCIDGAIKTSPRLRQHLYLTPAVNDGSFRTAFDGNDAYFSRSLSSTTSQPLMDFTQHPQSAASTLDFNICFSFDEAEKPLPRIGARCRSMLVCQPPLKTMQVELACNLPCSYKQNDRCTDVTGPIASDVGITVGDILDATAKLCEAHKLCPYPDVADHDHDGAILLRPTFTADLRFRRDSVFVVAHLADEAGDAEFGRESHERYLKLKRYTHAKFHAHRAGLPIPTMREFEAWDT